MSDVVIDLITPNGMTIASTKVPGDLTAREIISDLVDQLELPWNVNGHKVEYKLKWENQGRFLAEDQILADAGVTNGQTVRLYSPSQNGKKDDISGGKIPVQPVGGTVEVALTLLDLNKNLTTAFAKDVQIGTLIGDIVKTYSLPERGPKDVPIVYCLISKYLGKMLSPDLTLAQEGVPEGDRLTLQKGDIAGRL